LIEVVNPMVRKGVPMAHNLSRTVALLALFLFSISAFAKTVCLTETDNNTRVALNPGDTLVIKLKSNPTTGYMWALSGDVQPQLRSQGSEVQPSQSGLMGAGGYQIFRFTAADAGQESLALAYQRSFEKGVKPIQEFGVTVVVEGRGASSPEGKTAGSSRPTGVLIGHYRGLLPCADCSGIETNLWLYAKRQNEFADTSYKMTFVYQGKGRSFDETGTWLVSGGSPDDKDAVVYQLKATGSGSVQNFLQANDRELIMLDAERRRLPLQLPATLRRVD
jgi:inhibitor of cysteine peptidase